MQLIAMRRSNKMKLDKMNKLELNLLHYNLMSKYDNAIKESNKNKQYYYAKKIKLINLYLEN